MFIIHRSENTPVIEMKLASILVLVTILIIVTLGAGCTSASTSQSCTKVVVAQTPTAYVPQVEYLEISPSEINDARVGDSRQFTATAYDGNNNRVSGAKITWKITSGTSKATISSRGELHAKAVGEIEVTASSGGESATAYVTVRRTSSYQSTYTSYKHYSDDDDDSYNYDSFDDDLPSDHCFYKSDFLEKMVAKRVPCNR